MYLMDIWDSLYISSSKSAAYDNLLKIDPAVVQSAMYM